MRPWLISIAAALALTSVSALSAEEKTLHVYNWSDYIAEDTLSQFEQRTGIKVIYDVYDSNEMLEAKLFAGNSGYDVVFPSAQPFAKRHVAAGLYAKLDRKQLANFSHLDSDILKELTSADPNNAYLIPYMWGTTGLGYNVDKLQKALGGDVPADSWRLLFDPAIAAKLADCGISMLDDEQEAFAAALLYLGKDPNSSASGDLTLAAKLLQEARPFIKYFHSSQYINDLANGDICLAHGYSGDVVQARDRADEADNQVHVAYAVPEEGAVMWIDTIAIPQDAPHAQQAHQFIDYLLQPAVIASITDYVAYANANADATPLVSDEVRNDPSIYPPPQIKARLASAKAVPDDVQRLRTRLWTRVKTGQ